jgi:hypothetical protein
MSYFRNARIRARQRLASPWTIPLRILGFVLTGAIWLGSSKVVWWIHLQRFPTHSLRSLEGTAAGHLMFVPLFFASVPVAMLLSNYVAHLVPSIRSSLDGVEDFQKSQKQFWKLIWLFSLPFLAISIVGATYRYEGF